MLSLHKGDLFSTNDRILINPVNLMGISGAGLAKIFKDKYYDNFIQYSMHCNENYDVNEGLHYTIQDDVIIVNFPTKKSPADYYSDIDLIKLGLIKLNELCESLNIYSISSPLLGGGLGHLDRELILDVIRENINNKINFNLYEL